MEEKNFADSYFESAIISKIVILLNILHTSSKFWQIFLVKNSNQVCGIFTSCFGSTKKPTQTAVFALLLSILSFFPSWVLTKDTELFLQPWEKRSISCITSSKDILESVFSCFSTWIPASRTEEGDGSATTKIGQTICKRKFVSRKF